MLPVDIKNIDPPQKMQSLLVLVSLWDFVNNKKKTEDHQTSVEFQVACLGTVQLHRSQTATLCLVADWV